MEKLLASWRRWPGAMLIVLPVLAGCGGAPLEYNDNVTGTVRLDGDPLANVRVVFMPQSEGAHTLTPSSSAMTDEEGRFTLKCDNLKPGAVLGNYRVIIQQNRGKHSKDRSQREKTGPSIPPIYASVTNSPLVLEITKDRSVYDLNLISETH